MQIYDSEVLLETKVKPIYFNEDGKLTALYDNVLLIKTLKRIEADRAAFLPAEPRASVTRAADLKRPFRHLVDCKVLWSLYCCYRVIVWDLDLSDEDKFILAVVVLAEAQQYMEGRGFDEEQRESFIASWKNVLHRKNMTDLCWAALDVIFETVLDPTNRDAMCWQNIGIDPDMHTIEIFPVLADAYHAMCYQLLLHIQNGEAGRDGRARVICQGCGKEFIRESPRNRYCEDCRKLTSRVARSRAKKKEAEKDGQH